ncbi:L,D-transpeptidase [Arcobacter cryaerophilus gv. pseudocryaerophilus]|uniref:L,D-transpeptidase n=3 Tax=unclassified Arcobacter TaxID=2593671 RepID=A0AA96DEQ1_9BACT|nr:L,D-transpeptidase [Arcobacter sp. AZ-2023]WPD05767.1 L,D-transpeptidase [Arcobacter sp. DSM 115956]WPD07859.1 L,D-transpeptidase [Arcobacter sp. DSM 115955]WNL32124.1 L,D-transpeptidase [Arcobacter sp. AZ-2023]WNP38274.1 L,D-transpeptidase [Arcobacter sp. AZ-2023]
MKKSLFLILILPFCLFANEKKYTVSVCTTSTLENALVCKKRIYDNTIGEVFIVKQNQKYYTYLNTYDDKEIAKVTIQNASKYVKDQKPYIKEIDIKIVNQIDKRKLFIDMDNPISLDNTKNNSSNKNKENREQEEKEFERVKPEAVNIPIVSMLPENIEILGLLPYDNQNIEKNEKNPETKIEYELKSEIDFGNQSSNDILSQEDEEELLQTSLNEFDEQIKKGSKNSQTFTKSYEKKVSKSNLPKEQRRNLNNYDELIIKVDSKTNIMELFAKNGENEEKIKSYIVSTGKNSIKKPLGVGRISQISLNPVWYPTADTKKSFAKKGIVLPNVVPPNHKYNYMGMAKLNLTHSVDGNTTYRIHGTLNEKTLGSNESAGCIRMRNNDVVELAILLEEFANIKTLNKIKVVLI